METKPIRLEIAANAIKSRIWLGDEEISSVVRKITIECEAGDVTRIKLDCFKLDSEPWVIEGRLLETEPEPQQEAAE